MPPAQLSLLSHAPSISERGSVNRTLVWALTLACVVLLLPFLIINTAHKPLEPTANTDAWLEFVSSEFATIVFDEAPVLMISLDLIRPMPSDDDEEDAVLTLTDESEEPILLPLNDPLRWLDGRVPPLRSTIGPNHLQYKLDPDFGLENRALRLNGMIIRFWLEF